MKALLATESTRYNDINKSAPHLNEYNSLFKIKLDISKKWHNLAITKIGDEIARCTLNGKSVETQENPWIQALLEASENGFYSADDPRTFQLKQEGDHFYYDLTEECGEELLEKTLSALRFFDFKETIVIQDPISARGPNFSDVAPKV